MTRAFRYPAYAKKLGFLRKINVYIKKEKTNAVKSPVYSQKLFLHFPISLYPSRCNIYGMGRNFPRSFAEKLH